MRELHKDCRQREFRRGGARHNVRIPFVIGGPREGEERARRCRAGVGRRHAKGHDTVERRQELESGDAAEGLPVLPDPRVLLPLQLGQWPQ